MNVGVDELSGQLRLVAPARALRLGARPEGCPFCPGNEHTTPTETFRIAGGEAGWVARSFPNLYPLARIHEVLVPCAQHATSLRQLNEHELLTTLQLWKARMDALTVEVGDDEYAHLFVNDGAGAGASLPHTHAQLAIVPRTSLIADTIARSSGASCRVCQLSAGGRGLELWRSDTYAISAPQRPRFADTLILAPLQHGQPFEASEELAHCLLVTLRAIPEHDFNVILVTDPRSDSHWYLECIPRFGQLAGYELGTGISVCITDPVISVAAARERLGAIQLPADSTQ